MSWISGVFLLFLTLAMGFTGQLLRWDSNGVWSAVVAAEQVGRIPLLGTSVARLLLGGSTIGGQSLSRFYSYHTLIFPALLFGLVGVHLFLVLRNGISEPAEAGPSTPKRMPAGFRREPGRAAARPTRSLSPHQLLPKRRGGTVPASQC